MDKKWAVIADVIVVGTFVVLGRDTHESGFALRDVIRVASPFLLALAVMWSIPQLRLERWRFVSGAIIGAGTALVGMALRVLIFGDGVSGAFPIVAFAFLTGVMAVVRGAIGWNQARTAS